MVTLIKSGETKLTAILLEGKVFLLIVQDNIHTKEKKVIGFGDTMDKDVSFFTSAPGRDRSVPFKTNKNTPFRKF
jgi:hypothetical protein